MVDPNRLPDVLSGALGRIQTALESGNSLSSGTLETVRKVLLRGLRPETPREVQSALFRVAKRAEGSLVRELDAARADGVERSADDRDAKRPSHPENLSFMIGFLAAYTEALQQSMKLSRLTPEFPDLPQDDAVEVARELMAERQEKVCALLLEAGNKGLSNTELAQGLGLSAKSIGRSLRALRARGLVYSVPFGRRTQNVLSTAGFAAAKQEVRGSSRNQGES